MWIMKSYIVSSINRTKQKVILELLNTKLKNIY